MKNSFMFVPALLLWLSLAFPGTSLATDSFEDVTVYNKEINFLTDQGIISGYPDGSFKPEESISRKQAVEMILQEKGMNDFTAPNPGFTDLDPDDPEYPPIAKAVDLGIINGKVNKKGEKHFDSYGRLTRAQMAKILVLAYDLDGKYDKEFTDVPVDHFAHDYISTLAANNITTGYSDGSFKLGDNLSRQHFSVFMARLLDDSFIEVEKPEAPDHSELPLKDFDDISLGMSKTALKKAEPTELYSESSDVLMYRNKEVLDYPADVLYEFNDDELNAINVFHHVMDHETDFNTLENYFNIFYDDFSDVYGEPSYSDVEWSEDRNENVLSAMWLGDKHDVLLTVQLNNDDSSLGGIRISNE